MPIAADSEYGVAVCILPMNHEGEHNGGLKEELIGRRFAAQIVESWEDRNYYG